VPTGRLATGVLSVAGRTGPAVLFVHGNVSSSLFWRPTMLALPDQSVLGGYAAVGGRFREVAIDEAAHSPHLDQPERFLAGLSDQLASA